MKKYLIIGAGNAGISICDELRKQDKKSSITVISNEKIFPYNRIWITDFLANPDNENKSYFYLKSPKWFADNDINLHISTTITKIDYDKKIAYDEFNKEYKYDKLFLTAGSRGVKFPIEGIDKGIGIFNNIFYDDTKNIHKYILKNFNEIKNIVIMGGGVLGLEAADALMELKPNIHITIFDIANSYLSVLIDPEAGKYIENIIKKLKINSKFQSSIIKFNYDTNNKLKSIVTKNNEELPCELCIVSVGNASNFQNFLDNGKLKTNRGIIVNEFMETNIPNVYAAGDIIEMEGIILPKLVSVALASSKIAVNTALNGAITPFKPKKYNCIFSGLNMEIATIGMPQNINNNDRIYKKSNNHSFVKYVFRGEDLIWGVSINDKISYKEILLNQCKPF